MPTSLFYYINGHFFKFATNHKELSQACPHSILMHFSQGSIPESLVKKNSQLTSDKVIQRLLKVTTSTVYRKCIVTTNVE